MPFFSSKKHSFTFQRFFCLSGVKWMFLNKEWFNFTTLFYFFVFFFSFFFLFFFLEATIGRHLSQSLSHTLSTI